MLHVSTFILINNGGLHAYGISGSPLEYCCAMRKYVAQLAGVRSRGTNSNVHLWWLCRDPRLPRCKKHCHGLLLPP